MKFLNLFLIVMFKMINIFLLFHYFLRFTIKFYQEVWILFLEILILLFRRCLGFIVLFRILFLQGCHLMIIGFLVFNQIILFGLLFQVQLFY